MKNLPLIVGFGGVNSAGRSSNHMAYQRMVFDALSQQKRTDTLNSLAMLMGRSSQGKFSDTEQQAILSNTLIRKLNDEHYNPCAVEANKRVRLSGEATELTFIVDSRDLPELLPDDWTVTTLPDGRCKVSCTQLNVLLPDTRSLKVSVAGQIPTGLDIGALYPSRNHPKGLEMTVFGASDAIGSLGIEIETLKQLLPPDQIGVYACSSMGQLDDNGVVGYAKAAMMGRRATSKQLPLGFPEMPGDFINAYMLGSAGFTGGVVGACASFLYNLEHAVKDIQAGRRQVAIVGVSEAPITPEVMEGYRTMGALADDEGLLELDAHLGLSEPRYTHACRPFGLNCGFTMGESAQFAILFSAEFALKTGARILGAVPGVFTHADAFKKSISSPGIGNYLCLGKAVSLAEAMLGEQCVQTRSYVHAHGTGTPQNRVTESHVINEIAKIKGIQSWPVTSVKCYLGHSLGAAGGDQMMSALGTWNEGLIPGIFTVDQFADDVHGSNLRLSQKHIEVGRDGIDVAFLNSKGFGGNNATACVFSPQQARQALESIAGKGELQEYARLAEQVETRQQRYYQKLAEGEHQLIYRFGEGVLAGEALGFSKEGIRVPGYENPLSLKVENPYK